MSGTGHNETWILKGKFLVKSATRINVCKIWGLSSGLNKGRNTLFPIEYGPPTCRANQLKGHSGFFFTRQSCATKFTWSYHKCQVCWNRIGITQAALSRWYDNIKTFLHLLAHCGGNPLLIDGFLSQKTSHVEFWFFFFVLCQNNMLNKKSSSQWFETH